MRREPSFEPEKDHGSHTLRRWSGTVVGLNGSDVFVELGPRMQGVIDVREFEEPPVTGDVHEFTLRGKEESLWALALADARSLASWEDMEVGSLVAARVARSVPGGLQLKIGPLHAFMPRSHTGVPREQKPEVLVGKTITCEVIEVDAERQRVIVSRKLVLRRERENRTQREVGGLQPGSVVHGRVSRVEDYGAFVRFGRGMEGLIHVSNISIDRIGHPSEVLKEGDSVEAKVLYIRRSGKRIGLGLKQMHESPWRDVERNNFVGQVVEGQVSRLVEFGVFVTIRRGVEGLLHNSQSTYRNKRLRDVLHVGDRISVRIVEFDPEDERLSLSLLHENGAAIERDAAADAKSFQEYEGESDGEAPLRTNLGGLLRRALEPPGEDASDS